MTADYFDAGFEVLKGDVMAVVTPLQQATSAEPNGKDPESPERPVHTARRLQQVAGAAGAALGLPLQLLNTGFALATSKISALLPPFPAATLGSLYLGPPHCHTHPPSLTPPNPVPVPLPSLGPILLGTSIRVLIGGLPAARCGDIGMAITCAGLVPAFEVKTGSSKVFIGGARAARAIDFCLECAPGAGAMDGLAKASLAIGMLGGAAGVVADLQEANDAAAGDAAMASAQTLAAAMGTAQLLVDVGTLAIKQAMGKDVAAPPMQGNIVDGNPKVLIGGFPMINLPDPMQKLFEKLKAKFGKSKSRANADESEEGCKTCPG
jgi:uncharacterized Zn-binding protein involved in type VI secretion